MSIVIEVRTPRYHDNKALIATWKVSRGMNLIRFTKDKRLEGKVFEFDGDKARKCPTQKNGNGTVFVVPMEYLIPLGEN